MRERTWRIDSKPSNFVGPKKHSSSVLDFPFRAPVPMEVPLHCIIRAVHYIAQPFGGLNQKRSYFWPLRNLVSDRTNTSYSIVPRRFYRNTAFRFFLKNNNSYFRRKVREKMVGEAAYGERTGWKSENVAADVSLRGETPVATFRGFFTLRQEPV